VRLGTSLVDGPLFATFHIFHNNSKYYSPHLSVAFRYGLREASRASGRSLPSDGSLMRRNRSVRFAFVMVEPLDREFRADAMIRDSAMAIAPSQTGNRQLPGPPRTGREGSTRPLRPMRKQKPAPSRCIATTSCKMQMPIEEIVSSKDAV
jgi:hypothetical protein